MTAPGPGTPDWGRPDTIRVVLLALIAMAVRAAFVAIQQLPPFDPWRHLALVRNLRAGLGFTLFEGQPYLWYNPLWYRILAWLPESLSPAVMSAILSAMGAPLAYAVLRRRPFDAGRHGAGAGALLFAVSGPIVHFTCHYGPEAFALVCTLAALLVCGTRFGAVSGFAAGLLFGAALVSRMNFVFASFLFLPFVRDRGRFAGLAAGAALPVAAHGLRNHRIIADHAWIFTWDGLATPADGFNALSTLVVQMHPAIQEGLRRLHEIVVPWPEWIFAGGQWRWERIAFVACGTAALLACRRWSIALSGFSGLVYFLAFDGSMSSHFFRIYLPLFPAFFFAAALTIRDSRDTARPAVRRAAIALPIVLIAAGTPLLRPATAPPLDAVTPPADLLEPGHDYLVNSAYYHPESLIYRFPQIRFAGMPLDPERFEEFRARFPGYDRILWHDFGVQNGLASYLEADPNYVAIRQQRNRFGRAYTVLVIRTGSNAGLP